MTSVFGSGKLAASIDDFRFWKKRRTGRQIKRWHSFDIGGGTNYNDSNYSLGVYYKFNEGIHGTEKYDQNILDYSGRGTNARWYGKTVGLGRSLDSAITEATGKLEFKDPTIYRNHPAVVSLIAEKTSLASREEGSTTSQLWTHLPQYIVELNRLDDPEASSDLKNLLNIVGSYFDELWLQVEAIRDLKTNSYDNFSKTPAPFLKRMLEHSGLDSPEIFIDATVHELLHSKNDEIVYERDLIEVKNLIYQNIYSNLNHIYKSKGTMESFDSLIRCFGIDDDILKVNLYASETEYKLEDNYKNSSVRKKYIDFDDDINLNATIVQKSNPTQFGIANNASKSYIESSIDSETQPSYALSAETEFFFPKESVMETSSLFGCFAVSDNAIDVVLTAGTDPTAALGGVWPDDEDPGTDPNPGGTADFQVYAVGVENSFYEGAKFVLKYRIDGVEQAPIETDFFADVYEESKWNIAVSIYPATYPFTGASVPSASSSDAGYTIKLAVVQVDTDVVVNESSVSRTITAAHGVRFLNTNKRFYLGALRAKSTGVNIGPSLDPVAPATVKCNAKPGHLRVWLSKLEDSELRQHAIKPLNYGVDNPMFNILPAGLDTELGDTSIELPKSETLMMDWSFDNITGSNSSGEIWVSDYSSGSLPATPSQKTITEKIKTFHTGHGFGFRQNSQDVLDKRYIFAGKLSLPESVAGNETVRILSQDDVHFTLDSKPKRMYVAIEKSMYQGISQEMIKIMHSITEFGTVIGAPVNKYRKEYKSLNKLREIFYRNIENTPQLERYLEFYKWIDSSLSIMLQKLMPATVDQPSGASVRNIVESHAFERNKYQHKFPTFEMQGEPPETVIRGHAELNYNWRLGHAPVTAVTRYAQPLDAPVKAIIFADPGDRIRVADANALSFGHAPGIRDTPPGSPHVGEAYIVGDGNGAWTDNDDDVATWNGAQWVFSDYDGPGTIQNPGVLPFTISLWARPPGSVNFSAGAHTIRLLKKNYEYEIVLKYAPASGAQFPQTLEFMINDGGASGSSSNTGSRRIKSTFAAIPFHETGNAPGNIFHHIVAISDPTHQHKVRLYVNAVEYAVNGTTTSIQISNNDVTNMRNGVSDLIIGDDHRSIGYVADISMFNKALTAAEVTEIYNTGKPFTLKEHPGVGNGELSGSSARANMVAWWKMGEGDDIGANQILDSVGTSHGSLEGDADIVTYTNATQVTGTDDSTYSINNIVWLEMQPLPVAFQAPTQEENCLWWKHRAEREKVSLTIAGPEMHTNYEAAYDAWRVAMRTSPPTATKADEPTLPAPIALDRARDEIREAMIYQTTDDLPDKVKQRKNIDLDATGKDIPKLVHLQVDGTKVKYEASPYFARRLNRHMQLNIERQTELLGGSNFEGNKKHTLYRAFSRRLTQTQTLDVALLIDIPDTLYDHVCDDEQNIRIKRRLHATAYIDANISGEEWDADSNLIAPFSIYEQHGKTYSADTRVGYAQLLDGSKPENNLDITNFHVDSYGDDRAVPMQGPFAAQYVGGYQNRNIKFGDFAPGQAGRPEAYQFITPDLIPALPGYIGLRPIDIAEDNVTAHAVYARDEFAKRPINIRNIRDSRKPETSLASGFYEVLERIGNYQHDYQILQVNGRNVNNRDFIKNTPAYADLVMLPSLVNKVAPVPFANEQKIGEWDFETVAPGSIPAGWTKGPSVGGNTPSVFLSEDQTSRVLALHGSVLDDASVDDIPGQAAGNWRWIATGALANESILVKYEIFAGNNNVGAGNFTYDLERPGANCQLWFQYRYGENGTWTTPANAEFDNSNLDYTGINNITEKSHIIVNPDREDVYVRWISRSTSANATANHWAIDNVTVLCISDLRTRWYGLTSKAPITRLSGGYKNINPSDKNLNSRHIIVERFSSPGDMYTMGNLALDRLSGQFSPYNAMTYRSPRIKKVQNINSEIVYYGEEYYDDGEDDLVNAHVDERMETHRDGSKTVRPQHKIHRNSQWEPALFHDFAHEIANAGDELNDDFESYSITPSSTSPWFDSGEQPSNWKILSDYDTTAASGEGSWGVRGRYKITTLDTTVSGDFDDPSNAHVLTRLTGDAANNVLVIGEKDSNGEKLTVIDGAELEDNPAAEQGIYPPPVLNYMFQYTSATASWSPVTANGDGFGVEMGGTGSDLKSYGEYFMHEINIANGSILAKKSSLLKPSTAPAQDATDQASYDSLKTYWETYGSIGFLDGEQSDDPQWQLLEYKEGFESSVRVSFQVYTGIAVDPGMSRYGYEYTDPYMLAKSKVTLGSNVASDTNYVFHFYIYDSLWFQYKIGDDGTWTTAENTDLHTRSEIRNYPMEYRGTGGLPDPFDLDNPTHIKTTNPPSEWIPDGNVIADFDASLLTHRGTGSITVDNAAWVNTIQYSDEIIIKHIGTAASEYKMTEIFRGVVLNHNGKDGTSPCVPPGAGNETTLSVKTLYSNGVDPRSYTEGDLTVTIWGLCMNEFIKEPNHMAFRPYNSDYCTYNSSRLAHRWPAMVWGGIPNPEPYPNDANNINYIWQGKYDSRSSGYLSNLHADADDAKYTGNGEGSNFVYDIDLPAADKANGKKIYIRFVQSLYGQGPDKPTWAIDNLKVTVLAKPPANWTATDGVVLKEDKS